MFTALGKQHRRRKIKAESYKGLILEPVVFNLSQERLMKGFYGEWSTMLRLLMLANLKNTGTFRGILMLFDRR